MQHPLVAVSRPMRTGVMLQDRDHAVMQLQQVAVQQNEAEVVKKYGERWYRLWLFFLHWSAIIGEQGSAFNYQVTMHKNHDKFDRMYKTRKV